ncbi:MAG: copper chaperone PCu(A)C [Pseudomonadota bacterium]|nr:copper chaperone PCu(A)C [Pseudomonadota bacterium]
MSSRFLTTVAAVASLCASSLVLASDIQLSNPAVRAMPPGAPASGAYVTVTNHSDQDRYLVAAESDVADAVEVHLSEMQGDTMKMYQVEQVLVPAHGQAQLKPGSYHIMMMGLKKPLKAGDQVAFTLVMKNGERLPLIAPVLSPEEMTQYMPAGMKMKSMDHSKMNHGNHKKMAEGEHSNHH